MRYVYILFFLFYNQIFFCGQYFVDINNPQNGNGTSSAPWNNLQDITFTLGDKDIILNIYPGSYYAGNNSSVDSEGDKSFFRFYDCNSLTIRNASTTGTVTFYGYSGWDCGIKVKPNRGQSIKNITIENIRFMDFRKHAIFIRGWTGDTPIICNNVNINNCYSEKMGEEAFIIQYSSQIQISNCTVLQDLNSYSETDGIFINDGCKGITLKNNYVKLSNNYYSSDYHCDCIQIAGSTSDLGNASDLLVENNTLINSSIISTTYDRSGLIINEVDGFIKIYNNAIASAQTANLLNIHSISTTQKVWVFNNTLSSLGNPPNLFSYKDESNLPIDLQIKNNIFYKKSFEGAGSDLVAIKFEDILPSEINSTILDYNVFTISNLFLQNPVNMEFDFYTNNNKELDPGFVDLGNFNLMLKMNSAVKNLCNPLPEITKDISGKIRPYWQTGVDPGSYEVDEALIRIGVPGSTSVQNTITAVGTYWEKGTTNWPISTAQDIAVSSYTIINSNENDKESWDGFHYKWLKNITTDAVMGCALYKISNEFTYFYLDCRDAITTYNPNIYLKFDINSHKYSYWKNNSFDNLISQGQILRIWEINNGTYNTTGRNGVVGLENYWSNSLVCVNIHDHPNLIFGPYSAANGTYKVYKIIDVSGGYTFQYFATPDSFKYEDLSESYLIGNFSHGVSYKILDIILPPVGTQTSNSIITTVSGGNYKINNNSVENFNWLLNQNYPNPFNPTTTIQYCIKEKGVVKLQVFDLLGRVIKTLINEEQPEGNYELKFNAKDLSSGIYFYRLTAGTYCDIKKMQLIK